MPSTSNTKQDLAAPVREGHTERNPEIEQLQALIKQFMIIVEADSKQSRKDSATNANATRELSTHVQALSEKITNSADAKGSTSKSLTSMQVEKLP